MSPRQPGEYHPRRRWLGRVVLGLLAALIVFSAAAAMRTTSAFLASMQQATHSREVLEVVDHLRGMVVDAETGVRGYILTGDVEYLQPYDAATSGLDATLARLAAAVADNSAQLERVQAVEPAIRAKMAWMQHTRALREESGFEAAVAAVGSGEGRRLMVTATDQLAALRAAETDVLVERDQQTARELARTEQLLSLLALATLALLAIAVVLVERDFARAARRIDREIAARREGQVLLDEREEQTRAVRDTVKDAIITINEYGIIQTANVATELLFGYRSAELVGQNVKMLMPAPDRDEHDDHLRAYRLSGIPKVIGTRREVTARRSDGSLFPVDLALSEATIGHQRLFTGVLRDLSERERVDADVKELQRLVEERGRLADIGAVTAQIVHDLGNPLAGLSMQVQRLVRLVRRSPSQVSDAAAGVAEQIQASVRRLDGMLRELGEFSSHQHLDRAAIDPAQFLHAVGEAWRPVAAARGIALRVDLSHDGRLIVADYAKLFRVLDNLVKNAIEAIGAGPGEISLQLTTPDLPRPTVRISISDDGPGLRDGVDVFRLFETTKLGGSGLGLPIARRIVEAHGGHIRFERRAPRGTVFHIDLPVQADVLLRLGDLPTDPPPVALDRS